MNKKMYKEIFCSEPLTESEIYDTLSSLAHISYIFDDTTSDQLISYAERRRFYRRFNRLHKKIAKIVRKNFPGSYLYDCFPILSEF